MVLSALIIFRCGTEDDERYIAPQQPYVDLAQDTELYDYLDCQGFDLTDAKLYDEHVLVEGDLYIRLDVIRKKIEEGKQDISAGRTSQFVVNTGSVVDFNNVLNIDYFIDNSVGPIPGDWEGAIDAATQDWEDISSCRVSFNEVATAGAADIIFYADNDTALPACARNLGGAYAAAEFPADGQPGSWISINDADPSATQGNRETVIRHEIGHTLGFRHDDPINGNDELVNYTSTTTPPACGNDVLGANKLVGTPTSDGSSIMIPVFGTSTTIDFSSNDEEASIYLYPAGYSAPVISSLTQYYASPTTKDVKVTMSYQSVRMYRYRVERLPPWSSTPVQTNEYTTTGSTFWLYDVPHGTWDFRITSLNYARDATMPGIKKQVTIQ